MDARLLSDHVESGISDSRYMTRRHQLLILKLQPGANGVREFRLNVDSSSKVFVWLLLEVARNFKIRTIIILQMVLCLNKFEFFDLFVIWLYFWNAITFIAWMRWIIWMTWDAFNWKSFAWSFLDHLAEWLVLVAVQRLWVEPACINLAVWLN